MTIEPGRGTPCAPSPRGADEQRRRSNAGSCPSNEHHSEPAMRRKGAAGPAESGIDPAGPDFLPFVEKLARRCSSEHELKAARFMLSRIDGLTPAAEDILRRRRDELRLVDKLEERLKACRTVEEVDGVILALDVTGQLTDEVVGVIAYRRCELLQGRR